MGGHGGLGRPTGMGRAEQADVGLEEIPVGGPDIRFYTHSYQARQVGFEILTGRPGMGWAKYHCHPYFQDILIIMCTK
jgi:hypothetical protein